MKHSMIRIPNCFIDLFEKSAELKLACVFYSLINADTPRDILGNYVISASQKTLANLCGTSEMTVRRTAKQLMNKGFITSQHRPVSNRQSADGFYMLDKYVYTISCISCDTGYFRADRAVFCELSGQAYKVYMLFCKLSDSSKHYFYHSLSDLCSMLRIARTDLSQAIKVIEQHRLIRKIRKRTLCGDFTENTYIIVVYMKGRIHKRKPVKKISPCAPTQGADTLNTKPNSGLVLNNMINHLKRFVKGLKKKIRKKFDFRGSG